MNIMSCKSCGVMIDREVINARIQKLAWEQKRTINTKRLKCPVCLSMTFYPEYDEEEVNQTQGGESSLKRAIL